MTLSQALLLLALILASAFFSMAELSLAASRRVRLRQLADDGEQRAEVVMATQEQPGDYFTVVQVGQNAIAILGGIVGEGSLTPVFRNLFSRFLNEAQAASFGFAASFVLVTSAFILFSDLLPKRMGMNEPEKLAIRLIRPMQLITTLLSPLIWFYSKTADLLLRRGFAMEQVRAALGGGDFDSD